MGDSIDRIHARCLATSRVLVSGPSVKPFIIKWVPYRAAHRKWLGFAQALVKKTEAEAYNAVYQDHFENRIDSEFYND